MTADPRARTILREYRNATAQAPDARDALWDRIERSIDAGAELEPPEEVAPARPRRAAVLLAVVLGSSAVAAVGLAPRLWASPEPTVPTAAAPEPAAEAPDATPPPRAAPSATVMPEVPVVPRELEPVSTQRPVRAPARARTSEAEAPAAAPDEALREEMLLIARARAAMQKGQPSAALGVLEEHLRRFPKGQMREDRAVLRIEALCAVGKRRQAEIEVEAFTRTFPGSAHLARVQALCPSGQSIPRASGE